MNIPNSFSTTIFGKHRIQYESGAFGETDISNIFFFLPSIVDRIEEIINKYLGSVNLNAIDINIDKFGQNFDPSKLDVKTTESENVRKSVLRVLKKIAEHSSQNPRRNADGYLSSVSHNNDSRLWTQGKRTQSEKFSLSC